MIKQNEVLFTEKYTQSKYKNEERRRPRAERVITRRQVELQQNEVPGMSQAPTDTEYKDKRDHFMLMKRFMYSSSPGNEWA